MANAVSVVTILPIVFQLLHYGSSTGQLRNCPYLGQISPNPELNRHVICSSVRIRTNETGCLMSDYFEAGFTAEIREDLCGEVEFHYNDKFADFRSQCYCVIGQQVPTRSETLHCLSNALAYLCGKVYSNGATTYKEYIVQCYCPTSYKEPTEEEKGKCMLEALKKMDTHQRERFTRPRSCIAKEIAVLESKLRITRPTTTTTTSATSITTTAPTSKTSISTITQDAITTISVKSGYANESAVEIPLYTKKKNFQNQWKQILMMCSGSFITQR